MTDRIVLLPQEKTGDWYVIIDARTNKVRYSGDDEEKAAVRLVRGTVSGCDPDPVAALRKARDAALLVRGSMDSGMGSRAERKMLP